MKRLLVKMEKRKGNDIDDKQMDKKVKNKEKENSTDKKVIGNEDEKLLEIQEK